MSLSEMLQRPLSISLIFFLVLCSEGGLLAQKRGAAPPPGEISSSVDVMQQRLPREKLYLQLDKSDYAADDTIWFKGYLLKADSLDASYRSGIVYLELANDQNSVVRRISVPSVGGLLWGDFPLDTARYLPGVYTLRAYTNWMLNFGEAGVFSRQIQIVSAEKDAWMIGLHQKIEGDKVSVGLQLTNLLKQPLGQRDLQVRLLKNGKSIHNNKFTTDGDGGLNLDFDMPRTGARNLALDIQDDSARQIHPIHIPLFFHRPEDIDLQFMPEGGQLVAGYTQRIGFKAVGEDGKGVAVKGSVYNDQGHQVASFGSLHAGMGSFFLTVQNGVKYSARLTFPDSITKRYPLPEVHSSGTVIQVKEPREQDSLEISVFASSTLSGQTPALILLGQSGGGQLSYHKKFRLTAKGISLSVPTNLFAEGVARFTLMDSTRRPLNERLVFIHHDDNLKISLHTDQAVYHPNDSIALLLAVHDGSGQPIFGNFSVAVTDDSQVKINPTSGNILSYFYLSSCVKGYVEDPFYYFHKSDSATHAALDDLLLTQGWVGYDWKTILNPPQKPAYVAESTFEVKGTVVNGLNKPIKNAKVSLVSQKPPIVRATTTDRDGQFVFKNFPPVDTPRFFIQALNRHGKSFNIGLHVETFNPPQFSPSDYPAVLPWNVNMHQTLSDYITDNRKTQDEIRKLQLSGHVLKPVVVKAKKIIRGSYNLNGPGNADIVIDESTIEKARNISLSQFLRQHIPGLHIDLGASLNGYDVHFIIDGMTLAYVSGIKIDPLNTLTTSDIRGVEIMYSPKYVHNYDARYIIPTDPDFLKKRKRPAAYIEITTKRETTLWEQQKSGVYLYTPIPFTWPKEFYSPRYGIKALSSNSLDLRSAVYWEPNVDMETKGQGLVTFYAADRPGVYTVIVEGSDMKGHLGYATTKVKIEGK